MALLPIHADKVGACLEESGSLWGGAAPSPHCRAVAKKRSHWSLALIPNSEFRIVFFASAARARSPRNVILSANAAHASIVRQIRVRTNLLGANLPEEPKISSFPLFTV